MPEKNAVSLSHPVLDETAPLSEEAPFSKELLSEELLSEELLSEEARLETLQSYAVLDTPPEAAFDRITALAARLFDVSVSAISFIDKDRLWFKSWGGTGRAGGPPEVVRSGIPCPETIATRQVFVIEDSPLDSPFSLLSGPAGMRFYAGAPLLAPDGAVLGTLCLLDLEPRPFAQDKQDTLRDMAAGVVTELELRRALFAAQETETLHRQMFSENPYPMWVFDAQTLQFLDVNETALTLYGYTRTEFLALSLFDLWPEEGRRHLTAQLRTLFASSTFSGKRGIRQHQTKNGTQIWAEVSSHPVQFGGRNALMAVAQNITERCRTEDALRRSEQQFAFHIQQMPLAALEIASDMTITRWNPAAERIFGYSEAEAVGRSIVDLIVPEQEQIRLEQVRLGLLSGTGGTRFTNFTRTKSGTLILCDWYNTPLTDEDGNSIGCASLARDITDEVNAQEKLRRSEAHKAAILNSALDCIISIDPEGRVMDWNPAAERAFGYTQAEAEGQPIADLILPPPLRQRYQNGLRQHLSSGGWPALHRRVEIPVQRRDGTEFEAELTATVLETEAEPLYTLYLRDITDRKDMEREREELLQQTESLLADALSRVDYDPLTGLLNHRAFQKRLKEFLDEEEMDAARTIARHGAVLLIDLENFKFFNDAYGHLAGDDVLRRISRIFAAACRAGDVLARFGGDEFALLLPGMSQADAQVTADFLRENAAQAGYQPPGYETAIPFTLSVGIACFPDDGMTQAALLEAADARLRVAKSGGEADSRAVLVRRALAESVGGFTMLDALVTAVDNKDRYTRRHSEDVLHYSVQIAQALGLEAATLRSIETAALLHDVGKIGVPDAVLRKPGKLTDSDYEAIKQHPLMGSVIVGAVPGFEEALDAVRHHHERWDGGGYPFGLREDQTPLSARIMAVADAFSAMTTDRPYRKGMAAAQARAILEAGAGTQWDPKCVQAFLEARRPGTVRPGD